MGISGQFWSAISTRAGSSPESVTGMAQQLDHWTSLQSFELPVTMWARPDCNESEVAEYSSEHSGDCWAAICSSASTGDSIWLPEYVLSEHFPALFCFFLLRFHIFVCFRCTEPKGSSFWGALFLSDRYPSTNLTIKRLRENFAEWYVFFFPVYAFFLIPFWCRNVGLSKNKKKNKKLFFFNSQLNWRSSCSCTSVCVEVISLLVKCQFSSWECLWQLYS